jgi:hypothetical protein
MRNNNKKISLDKKSYEEKIKHGEALVFGHSLTDQLEAGLPNRLQRFLFICYTKIISATV